MREFKTPVVPASRPNISVAKAQGYLEHAAPHFDEIEDGPVVCFVRGYYLDSHGDPGANDHNTYDDAAFIALVKSGGVVDVWTYNANADPRGESGKNPAIGKGWPTIQPGIYGYRFGFHRGKYLALKPSLPVTVRRSASGRVGDFGPEELNATINAHAGGFSWTWSWGCLTIIHTQYGARTKSLNRSGSGFIDRLWRLAAEYGLGGSMSDGRATFRAHRDRKEERPILLAVVDEIEFRGS